MVQKKEWAKLPWRIRRNARQRRRKTPPIDSKAFQQKETVLKAHPPVQEHWVTALIDMEDKAKDKAKDHHRAMDTVAREAKEIKQHLEVTIEETAQDTITVPTTDVRQLVGRTNLRVTVRRPTQQAIDNPSKKRLPLPLQLQKSPWLVQD
jgi:hypothetical protein